MKKITTNDLLSNFELKNSTCNYTNNTPCIIDFNAKWCLPCKTIERTLNQLEIDNKDIIFYTIDIEDEYQLAEIFNITNLPTILICSNEQDTVRLHGNTNKQTIQEKINNIKVFDKEKSY